MTSSRLRFGPRAKDGFRDTVWILWTGLFAIGLAFLADALATFWWEPKHWNGRWRLIFGLGVAFLIFAVLGASRQNDIPTRKSGRLYQSLALGVLPAGLGWVADGIMEARCLQLFIGLFLVLGAWGFALWFAGPERTIEKEDIPAAKKVDPTVLARAEVLVVTVGPDVRDIKDSNYFPKSFIYDVLYMRNLKLIIQIDSDWKAEAGKPSVETYVSEYWQRAGRSGEQLPDVHRIPVSSDVLPDQEKLKEHVIEAIQEKWEKAGLGESAQVVADVTGAQAVHSVALALAVGSDPRFTTMYVSADNPAIENAPILRRLQIPSTHQNRMKTFCEKVFTAHEDGLLEDKANLKFIALTKATADFQGQGSQGHKPRLFAFNSAMVPNTGTYSYREISDAEARACVENSPSELVSSIRYPETADALSVILDAEVLVGDSRARLEVGDKAIVIRPRGVPRGSVELTPNSIMENHELGLLERLE